MEQEELPIREDRDGVWRVGKSRVLLELVMHAFNEGATPEEIIQQFPSLVLADVYGAIAWCLKHQSELASYMKHVDAEQQSVRSDVENRFPQQGIRARLFARQAHR